MTYDELKIIGGVVSIFLTYLLGRYTTKTTAKSTGEANAVAFNKNLLDRVTTLEAKDEKNDVEMEKMRNAMHEMTSVVNAAFDYIDALLNWGRNGGGPPEPRVPHPIRDRVQQMFRSSEES